jgi:hypothetical protein
MLVFDIEIAKAIPSKSEMKNPFFMEPGIDYCEGWEDFENMGIACLCTYDFRTGRSNVYLPDNLEAFFVAAFGGSQPRTLVSFNGINFDGRLLEFHVPDEYRFALTSASHLDLLQMIWKAEGLGPVFQYPSHTGYGLDAVAKANEVGGKSGNGAVAPVLWQQGKIGAVVDYCLHDVYLTSLLFDRALRGRLCNPRYRGRILNIEVPQPVAEEYTRATNYRYSLEGLNFG